MNHVQYLTAFCQVWQTSQDQDASNDDLDNLTIALTNYQLRNRLPLQCAADQLQGLLDEYNKVDIRIEGEPRTTSLAAFIHDNNAADPEQLQQSDIEDILAAPIGGVVHIGAIVVRREGEFNYGAEMYRGYEIQTPTRQWSHYSYIYKDGELIGASAGDLTVGGKHSITKAKAKIDGYLSK